MPAFLVAAVKSRFTWGVLPLSALSIILAEKSLWPGLYIYANASAAILSTLLVVGPMISLFAAWSGMAWGNRTLRDIEGLAVDRGNKAFLFHLAGPIFWSALVYLLSGAVIIAQTSVGASWGQPTWVWLFGGFVSVIVHATCGFVAGYFVPVFLTPPAICLALFGIDSGVFLFGNSTRIALLSLGYSQTQVVAFRINEAILWYQAIWYVGILMLLLGVAYALKRLSPAITRLLCVAGVVLTGLGASMVLTSPHGFYIYSHSGWSYTCSTGPTVCIHPAYQSARKRIDEALWPVELRERDTPFAAKGFEWTNRGYLGAPWPGFQAFHLDTMESGWARTMRLELAQDLTVPGSQSGGPCDGEKFNENGNYFAGYALIVVYWLAEEKIDFDQAAANEIQAQRFFESLTVRERKAWFQKNIHDICSGSLTSAQFK